MNRVIVALDFGNARQAFALVDRLGADAAFYKVGPRLLTAEGPDVVRRLIAQGKQVFLDLKLFEIPNSVAEAVAVAGELGVSMVTVHASGGTKILRAAVDAARHHPGLSVLALTVVTHMRDGDLAEVGVNGSVEDQVLRLGGLAAAAGCDGVVASPREASLLRSVLPGAMWIVTPGIQLPGDAATDQARVATPVEAINCGATHVVVGRSIARAADPREAYGRVRDQVAQALG